MMGIGSASPRGMSGLGSTWVYGRSLVPLPPANKTACILGPSWLVLFLFHLRLLTQHVLEPIEVGLALLFTSPGSVE